MSTLLPYGRHRPGALFRFPVPRLARIAQSGDSAKVRTRRPSVKSLQVYYSRNHTEERADQDADYPGDGLLTKGKIGEPRLYRPPHGQSPKRSYEAQFGQRKL